MRNYIFCRITVPPEPINKKTGMADRSNIVERSKIC